jgi:hypothetical protein
MNRYRTYGQLDDNPTLVGDIAFTKLDMLSDPATLPEGALALCENMRFDANGTTVRGGMARQFPAGSVINTIYGCAVFKPTADEDYIALATDHYLVLFNLATQAFTYALYPSGEVITQDDKVDLVQAGVGSGTLPTLFILRGTAKSVLQYDANTGAVTVASGFAHGDFALFYQDRIAVAQGQQVSVSDFLAFSSFNLLNQFQILKGGSDYLQSFLAFQGDYVLIGTRQGWYIAYFDPNIGSGGYSGGLVDSSFLRQLTAEAGPVGPKARLEAMGKIWFISGNAIYVFQPNLNNELIVLGRPISADIQPIMDRMCVRYAQQAAIERYGYRLYFALPISDVPVAVTNVTVTLKLTVGLILPFTLPNTLSTSALVAITTAADHGLSVGDRVQLTGAVSGGLNSEFSVLSVEDNLNFTVRLNITTDASAGTRMTAQKLATRNNCIAVFNLNNEAWESIDWLPAGLRADWLLAVEHAATRRLMVIDADNGPLLYEEADADEIGDIAGGIRLPFNLPVQLSAINFVTQPVAGHYRTRSYRWGGKQFMSVNRNDGNPNKVRSCEVRATVAPTDAINLNLLVRSPNNTVWNGSRSFTGSQFATADVPLRKQCGMRGLEAQVEISTTSGRPTFRSVLVEVVSVGRVEE